MARGSRGLRFPPVPSILSYHNVISRLSFFSFFLSFLLRPPSLVGEIPTPSSGPPTTACVRLRHSPLRRSWLETTTPAWIYLRGESCAATREERSLSSLGFPTLTRLPSVFSPPFSLCLPVSLSFFPAVVVVVVVVLAKHPETHVPAPSRHAPQNVKHNPLFLPLLRRRREHTCPILFPVFPPPPPSPLLTFSPARFSLSRPSNETC